MAINKIVVLNIEPQAKELKAQNKTEEEIATILSEHANTTITRSCVHRYFAAQVRTHQELIEQDDKLKKKVIEIELDTVQARHEVIQELRDLATQARDSGDITLAISGLHKAILALDSLDKRLGRFLGGQPVQVNINQTVQFNQQFNEFMSIILDEINPYDRTRIIAKLSQRALY